MIPTIWNQGMDFIPEWINSVLWIIQSEKGLLYFDSGPYLLWNSNDKISHWWNCGARRFLEQLDLLTVKSRGGHFLHWAFMHCLHKLFGKSSGHEHYTVSGLHMEIDVQAEMPVLTASQKTHPAASSACAFQLLMFLSYRSCSSSCTMSLLPSWGLF